MTIARKSNRVDRLLRSGEPALHPGRGPAQGVALLWRASSLLRHGRAGDRGRIPRLLRRLICGATERASLWCIVTLNCITT